MSMDVAAAGLWHCPKCEHEFHKDFAKNVSECASWGWEKVSSGASYVWNTTVNFGKDIYDKVLPYLGSLGNWFRENADLIWSFSVGAGTVALGFLAYYFFCKDGNEETTTATSSS